MNNEIISTQSKPTNLNFPDQNVVPMAKIINIGSVLYITCKQASPSNSQLASH